MFIKKTFYDLFFFIGSPLIALFVVITFVPPRGEGDPYLIQTQTPQWLTILAAILIFMHVMAGFTRSHLNPNVFNEHKNRFTWVPLGVFIVLASYNPLFVFVLPFVAIWDEIHQFMQTFGFGRIYDGKRGNDPFIGRKMDMMACFVIEYYPHIVRTMSIPYEDFKEEMSIFGDFTPDLYLYAPKLIMPMILMGVGFIFFYIFWYYQKYKKGYKFSWQKALLFLNTGVATLVIVNFYSIVDALVLSNIFHSLQYFAVVWVSEKKNILQRFKYQDVLKTNIFVLLCFGGGLFALSVLRIYTEDLTFKETNHLPLLGAFWITTSIMHFWYDGFIWSVRKKTLIN